MTHCSLRLFNSSNYGRTGKSSTIYSRAVIKKKCKEDSVRLNK